METAIISLTDALKIIQLKDREGKPFPFDLTYRTFNSQTKKGGKLKTALAAKYLPEANPNRIAGFSQEEIFSEVKTSKNPNHFSNRTRNIELADGKIRKVRIDFLISINNKKIIY